MDLILEDISLTSIGVLAQRVQAVVGQVRQNMFAPEVRKQPPTFNAGQMLALTGLEKPQFDYRVRRGDLPTGTLSASGAKREFTLHEARRWLHSTRSTELRPAGARAVTIAMGNFKGGGTKTTTAMSLAQGLSLRGHRVLAIDCDPQGSLTTLFGILPDTEVQIEDTVLPLLAGSEVSLRGAIQHTYWDGIDLVAAAPQLFAAEVEIAMRNVNDPSFTFWKALDDGLDDVRDAYDVIVIDTPPALSFVTINALMAADGIVMPLPPNAMDFASSAQFWHLFDDIANQYVTASGGRKSFAFIDVLPTRVENTDQASNTVLGWMGAAYTNHLLPTQIPKSAAANASSMAFATVFDAAAGGDTRTIRRATDAVNQFVDTVEDQVQSVWRKQLQQPEGVQK